MPNIHSKHIRPIETQTFRQAFANVAFNTTVNRREKFKEFDRVKCLNAFETCELVSDLTNLANGSVKPEVDGLSCEYIQSRERKDEHLRCIFLKKEGQTNGAGKNPHSGPGLNK